MSRLDTLRELVFEADNAACFIERERILNRIEKEMADYSAPDKNAKALAKLLSEVSVPIHECDYFAGRVVEDIPEPGLLSENEEHPYNDHLIASFGHLSPDYRLILSEGFCGMLARIKATAAEKGDENSKIFANNAEIVITAIKSYCERYAKAARAAGKDEMAKALETVPFAPAYDFYSALQSIWIIHMIASCYVGARDFAFGRFDQYMLPYYEKALADGMSEAEAIELLAGFMVKTNEICGRTTHNYMSKPVPPQAAKQYINIGGETPNEFSKVVLRAAMLNNMAQPQITVLLKPDAGVTFTDAVFAAMSELVDKLHIFNYDLILAGLIKKGIPAEIAKDFTYSACCTFDLHYHTNRQEYYVPVPMIFVDTLHAKDYKSLEELVSAFSDNIRADLQKFSDKIMIGMHGEKLRRYYVLDGLLLSDSALECRYHNDGNAPYNVMQMFCPGVATIGDSLMAIDRLVFKEKRYTYRELMNILDANFEGYEPLRHELRTAVRFGNDDDAADAYTNMAGNAYMDAIDALKLKDNYYAIGGFYSLERENTWREQVRATPDGRLDGDPFSENQSPVYGADKNGITALLNSVAKLPFERTATGGLNLTFSRNPTPDVLSALTLSYFEKGGFHVGISVIDREVLQDAMKHPEKYRSLTVRLYGFSEYFISLPDWQQLAVLNRTEYCC